MKNNIFLFFLLIFSLKSFSQSVSVIELYSGANKYNVSAFDFILSDYSPPDSQKVARMKGFATNTGKLTLEKVFDAFWDKSNELGGNAFVVDSVQKGQDTTHIFLTVYRLSEQQYKSNENLYPKNMIYVIGDIDRKQTAKKIKFNGTKMSLNPMQYLSYQNAVDKYFDLSIGGFTGASVSLKGREGRLPEFLSLSGFAVGPPRTPTIGLSFNTGRIYPVDLNFGMFLVNVLNEQK